MYRIIVNIMEKIRSKCKNLRIREKNIDELNHLSEYTSLKKLSCNNRKLTALPKLPETLEILDCHNNRITELPELPKSLLILNLNKNRV